MKSLPVLLLALLLVLAAVLGTLFLSAREDGSKAHTVPRETPTAVPDAVTAEDLATPNIAVDGETGSAPERAAVDTRTKRFGGWDSGAVAEVIGRVALPEELEPDEGLRVLALTEEVSPALLYGRGGVVERSRGAGTDPGVLVASGPVDPSGSFRLPVPGDTEEIWLAVDGRYLFSRELTRVELGREGTILLQPQVGAAVVGHVSFPDDASEEVREAAKATLSLDPENIAMNSLDTTWTFARGSGVDAEGNFELRAVPCGTVMLLALESDGLATAQVGGLELEPGRTREIELALKRGGTLRGRVVAPDGSGVAGAEVRAADRFLFGFAAGARVREETDAQGEFELRGVPEGRVKLLASADGYLEAKPLEVEVLDGAERNDLVLELREGAAIRGIVLFPDGAPVAGAEVRVGFDPNALMGPAAMGAAAGAKGSARTGDDGTFVVRGLGKGPFEVFAWTDPPEEAPDGPPWSARVAGIQPGKADLELTLEPPSGVEGRVTDLSGNPVTEFQVKLQPRGLGALFAERATDADRPSDVKTLSFQDEDGRFSLGGVRRGEWSLRVLAAGYAASPKIEFDLPEDEATPLEITLEEAAQVAGLVLDSNGAPVAGAKVSLRKEGSQALANVMRTEESPEAFSSQEGTFLLEGIPGGVQSVLATAPGYAPSEAQDLEVSPGERITDVVLTLREGGSIRGILYDKEGEPFPDGQVVVQNPATFLSSITKTLADGTFHLEHLEPGKWTVTAFRAAGDQFATDGQDNPDFAAMMDNLVIQTVDVRDGEETFVELGAPPKDPVLVSGRILEAGTPVGPGAITFTPAGGAGLSGLKIASFDEDGSYELKLDGPGAYHVQVQLLAGGGTQQQTIEFSEDVPEGESAGLDFELPGGSIRGTVYGPEGDPLPGARVSLSIDGGVQTGTFLGGQFAELATAPDGTFEFRFLRPGTYSVAAGGSPFGGAFGSAAPGGRVIHDGIRLGEGDSLQGIDFRLGRSGDIAGVVLGPDGNPVAGVGVFVRNASGSLLERFSMIASGPDGRFEYTGLAPGEYSLVAQGPGVAGTSTTSVLVREGETAQAEVHVEPGTILLVTVVNEKGEDVEAHVSVQDDQGQEYSGIVSYSQVLERLNSGFALEEQRIGPVPPGHYTVRAEGPGGLSAQKPLRLSGQPERKLKLRLH